MRAEDVPLPRLVRTPHGFRLMVDGRPALLLGGQLHNSASTSAELPEVMERVRGLNASTVIASASWSLVEPDEGRFDFSSVDDLLHAARAEGLRVVLIWFGAFKNAGSSYAPTWVRADPIRFPRAIVRSDRKEAFTHSNATAKPVLSVFSEALRSADKAAFVALIEHLRVSDTQHTVVMVQVENEVGLLRDSRDRSAIADAAWHGTVPTALLQYLHARSTSPSGVTDGGSERGGSWSQVFGDGLEAEEIFMAWYFASYAESLAAAGKAVKQLPMYANAWLGPQPGQPEPGDYPSGGPASRVLEVWKAAAPSIDFLSPDVYVDDVKSAIAPYRRPDNALFVPESRVATGNLFWALGRGAIGFSAFGIDDILPDSRLASAYALLSGMTGRLTEAQAEGRIVGILLDEGEQQELVFDDVRVLAQGARALLQDMLLDAGVQAPPPVVDAPSETDHGIPAPADTRAFGVLIREGADEFLAVGQNLALDFSSSESTIEIDSVEAGSYGNGFWTRTRVINGDERLTIVPIDEVGVTRIRTLRLNV